MEGFFFVSKPSNPSLPPSPFNIEGDSAMLPIIVAPPFLEGVIYRAPSKSMGSSSVTVTVSVHNKTIYTSGLSNASKALTFCEKLNFSETTAGLIRITSNEPTEFDTELNSLDMNVETNIVASPRSTKIVPQMATPMSSPFAPAAARSATPSFVPKLRPSASPPQHDSISPFSSFPATLSRAGSASARLAAASPVQNEERMSSPESVTPQAKKARKTPKTEEQIRQEKAEKERFKQMEKEEKEYQKQIEKESREKARIAEKEEREKQKLLEKEEKARQKQLQKELNEKAKMELKIEEERAALFEKQENENKCNVVSEKKQERKTPSKRPSPKTTPKKKEIEPFKQETPDARWGHAGVMYKNNALFCGGRNDQLSKAISSDMLWLYRGGQWKTLRVSGSGPGNNLMGHSIVVKDSSLFVIGGVRSGDIPISDIFMVSLSTPDTSWTKIQATGESVKIRYASAVCYRDCIVVFGGVDKKGEVTNDIQIFDLTSRSWSRPSISGSKPSPRSGHTATLIGEQMYVFGGWDEPNLLSGIYVLDLGLMEWRELEASGAMPPERTWHSATAFDHNILVYGGFDGDNALSDIHLLHLSENGEQAVWESIDYESRILEPRCGHVALAYDQNRLAVFGGGDNENEFYSKLHTVNVKQLLTEEDD